ncbi:MAG TPA: hypothetical protein VF624_14485 [Tepidisphaeraceae bacterium]|jgi:hypothetical protein
MHRPGIARTIGLLIVALLVIATVLYVTLGSVVGRPREADRLRHPAGFSAIGPPGWTQVVSYSGADPKARDSLFFSPPKSEGRPMAISFARRPAVDEAKFLGEGYVAETLAGRRTLHRQITTRDRRDVFLVAIDATWFEVVIVRHLGDRDDARWRQYVATLRVDSAPASLQSTATQPQAAAE